MLEERKNEISLKIERVIELENKLQQIKEVEKKILEEKEQLRQAMIEVNLKTWETPNGTKITLVEDIPESEIEVEVLDEETFKNNNKELIKQFEEIKLQIDEKKKDYITIEKKTKNGRKGYVRITLPKEKE